MKIAKYKSVALTVLVMAGLAPITSAQTKPAVELEGAIAKEQTTGDLKAAIAAYQKIAARSVAPRDVRARALLHLAACYEKQGQQARGVYQQIVRDYADQPAAKQANAKLAAMRQAEPEAASRAMTQRKFELPVSIPGATTGRLTDGQRVLYVDEATGDLTISDLSGANRRVVLKPNGEVEFLYPSRDLSMVYFQLTKSDGSRVSAVIGTDGSGYREVGNHQSCGAAWSWDNRFLLACKPQLAGPTDLEKISMADGETRKLGPTGAHAMRVSPDGRFVAYSVWESQFQQIYVAPIDGGAPQLISDRAVIMDWTRDGRYLLAGMDLSGSEALYLLPVNDGKKAGDPVFVRYGFFGMGHVTLAGAFVYPVPAQAGSFESWLGTLDPGGRPGGWKPLTLSSGSSSPTPAWSPDSSRIAYTAANLAAGQTTQTVRLRNVANGEDHELYRAGTGTMSCVWASQHQTLFCGQHASENRTEILSIAVDSGQARLLGSLRSTWSVGTSSRDDQSLYMMSPGHLMRWEIGTHQSSAVEDSRGFIPPSPDERWVVRRNNGTIEIRPMAGGAWKALGTIAPDGDVYRLAAFTPDGKWLLYQNFDAAGTRSFFRVSTDGGSQPERVGDLPGKGAAMLLSISTDGRRMIAGRHRADEMWMLENFEPKQ
jgi:Tol biopolymer transport system component